MDIRHRFNEHLRTILDNSLSAFSEHFKKKFLGFPSLFERHWTSLKHAHRYHCKRGLDFGCGTCPSLILGKLMGITVEGLDLTYTPKFSEPPFLCFQKTAQKQGYIVHHIDTDIIPWPLEENAYDFVLCWDSFFTDWKVHIDWKDVNIFQCVPRLIEINRILRSGGILYVGGGGFSGSDIDFVTYVRYAIPDITIQIYKWDHYNVERLG